MEPTGEDVHFYNNGERWKSEGQRLSSLRDKEDSARAIVSSSRVPAERIPPPIVCERPNLRRACRFSASHVKPYVTFYPHGSQVIEEQGEKGSNPSFKKPPQSNT